MPQFLKPSPRLVPVPPIDTANSVELTDEDFESWEQMFDEHGSKLDFLLAPGNYRSWGQLVLSDHPGHTRKRPKTIRYHDPAADHTLHPVDRATAARVESIRFELPQTRNWLIQGLTIKAAAGDPSALVAMIQGVRHVTLDACLIEGARQYGCRIREASHCTIQRCVIREVLSQTGGDAVGIYVGNVVADIRGIRILDNEIYNNGDGIQTNDHEDNPFAKVEVLVEGNDIYLDPSRYIDDTGTTLAENGIDLKAGSSTLRSTVIRNNRMWGFRHNRKPPKPDGTPQKPSAQGEILVVQRYCRNVVVRDNIFADAPRGMKDENWKQLKGFEVDEDKPRHAILQRNQFCDIRKSAEEDKAAIARPITAGLVFKDNHFARSDFLADATPPNYRPPAPVFEGNTLIDVDARQRPLDLHGVALPFDESLNPSAPPPRRYDLYQRKRWTGPEWRPGARPAPRVGGLPTHQQPDPHLRRI